jgi:hypothetical protein
MTPEDEKRLEEIRAHDRDWPSQTVRDLLDMVDSLREELRAEMSHEDTCPQDTKPCLCCPCTCPTRATLRAQVERLGEALAKIAHDAGTDSYPGDMSCGHCERIYELAGAALAPTKTEET